MHKKICIALLGMFAAATASAATIEMKVHGLVCGFCAQGVEKMLRKNPATEGVLVSLEKEIVAVTTKPGTDITDAELTRAIADAGYSVKRITRTTRSLDEVRSEAQRSAKNPAKK
ncbi:MAG: hypothetical protein K0Q92_3840 [Steroidobacteraceae bacterium]|jgi:copper chaperone CopZ|nr:hypothetical protein [Steroidobacteraceae bacterium]